MNIGIRGLGMRIGEGYWEEEKEEGIDLRRGERSIGR
jgi:hypothetical protein